MRILRQGSLGVALAALALVACSGAEQPRGRCPDVRILAGLDTNSVYRGGMPTGAPEELVYTAALQNIAGGCTYTGDGLTLSMSIDVIVDPGPAQSGPSIAVPWFVAIVGPDGTILDKQPFTATVAVDASGEPRGSREAIEQRFAQVGPDRGAAYRILFGLEVDRDEALRRRALLP